MGLPSLSFCAHSKPNAVCKDAVDNAEPAPAASRLRLLVAWKNVALGPVDAAYSAVTNRSSDILAALAKRSGISRNASRSSLMKSSHRNGIRRPYFFTEYV